MLFSLVEVVVVVVVVVVVGIMIVVFVVVDDGYDFSYVYLTCIQNVSLVQCLELCGGGGWWCKVISMSNPTSVEVKLRRVDAVVGVVTIFSRKT